jgi:membrane dipeptidase
VALGTDLDGGFGTEEAPEGIEGLEDLPRIGEALLASGYSHEHVRWILGENWLRVLREALPA